MNTKLSVLIVFVIMSTFNFLFIPDVAGQDFETSALSELNTIVDTKMITLAVSIMNIDGYTKTDVFTSLIENNEEKASSENSIATSCSQVELEKPIMVDPPSGQLKTISPEFRWNTIDNMNQEEMRLYIEVYEPDSTYSSAIVWIPVDINPRTNWIWFSNFKAEQEYEWYAYYYCPSNDTTGPLEYGAFTTGNGQNLPNDPTLISPDDNSFIQSNGDFTEVTFHWETNQSINYFVEYQPSDLFGTSFWLSTLWVDTDNSSIWTQDGTYEWRVKARNKYGIGEASEARKFVIGNEEDCISPTGLNICLLQKGDILLGRYNTSDWWVFGLGSTYWYHSAIVIEDSDKFQLAEASGPHLDPANQVRTLLITDTMWWKQELTDWSVVRLKPNIIGTSDIINEATVYAKQKAEQVNPYILYNTYFFDYEGVEDKFYCSQLVWKAYKKYGVDLRTLIAWVITPDDLYYSGKSEEVQAFANNQKRFIFSLHSPADLLIVDNQGRRVGFDSNTQQILNEIPGAYYTGSDAEPEYISVGVPNTTTLRLSVTGTGVGTYTLNAQSINSERLISQTIVHSVTLGQVNEFLIADLAGITTTTEILAEIKSKLYLPLIMRIDYP